jgi:hypothetical protein
MGKPGRFREAPGRIARTAGSCGILLLFLAGFTVTGCAAKQAETVKAAEAGPRGIVPIEIAWAYQDTVETNNIYGYNIYRSQSPSEGFEKINDDLVVPSPDNPNPEFVVYLDRGLPMGETFYYYVEAVLQDGSKHKVTPVQALRVVREMTVDEFKVWQKEQGEAE